MQSDPQGTKSQAVGLSLPAYCTLYRPIKTSGSACAGVGDAMTAAVASAAAPATNCALNLACWVRTSARRQSFAAQQVHLGQL